MIPAFDEIHPAASEEDSSLGREPRSVFRGRFEPSSRRSTVSRDGLDPSSGNVDRLSGWPRPIGCFGCLEYFRVSIQISELFAPRKGRCDPGKRPISRPTEEGNSPFSRVNGLDRRLETSFRNERHPGRVDAILRIDRFVRFRERSNSQLIRVDVVTRWVGAFFEGSPRSRGFCPWCLSRGVSRSGH